ncbi:peptidylprolyl isomerase [Paenibacillus sp. J2TS4]|uniref:peptidylprolyl isomerase n=1 Tax=Paenibacillus sp. J2TS4 TaxID=2807194 RepID=UPI001BD03D15
MLLAGCGSKQAGETTGGTPQTPPPAASPAPTESNNQGKKWSQPPAMTIDPDKKYQAEFDTSKGSFTIELFAKEAPNTVNNFVFLANEGFYEGVTFHRIIETFMIQTGDPTGTGTGTPGYYIKDELESGYSYEPGIVAMAKSGKDRNGSQFFICTGEDSKSLNLDPVYSIFGKVIDGIETVEDIAATPVKMNPGGIDRNPSLPTETVTINKIVIHES